MTGTAAPLVLQRTALECGPACLAMVLAAHGTPVPVPRLLHALPPGPAGLTVADLITVSGAHGLTASAYAAPAGALHTAPVPFIAHWRPHHYVVIEAWTDRWIRVLDPAVGACEMTRPEFEEHYTGVLICFRPVP